MGTYTGDRYNSSFVVGDTLSYDHTFTGNIDELAVYPTALSSTRLLAHYNAVHQPGFLWAPASYSTSQWNHVAWLYDGTDFSMYVNGRRAESLTSAGFNLNPTGHVVFGGSAGNYFTGALGRVTVSGTADGTSPGTTNDILKDYIFGGNAYRANKIEPIVTDNLTFYIDAANSVGGMSSHSDNTGCTTGTDTWDPVIGPTIGYFNNFSSCTTYGWQGDGTSTNPYSVKVDSTDDYIWFNPSDDYSFNGSGSDVPFSMDFWVNVPSSTNPSFLLTKSDWCWDGSNMVGCDQEWYAYVVSKLPGIQLYDADGDYIGRRSATTLTANTWTHVAYTYDGSGTSAGFKIYINGTEASSYTVDASGTYNNTTKFDTSGVRIGHDDSFGGWGNLQGSIALARIYKGVVLTQTQVRQNCHAQKARFNGATCAGP
jgi:hypothetical protein